MSEDIYKKLDSYGVSYSGEQVTADYHKDVDYNDQMTLAEVAAKGGRIVRVRILTEAVMGQRLADISYIYAEVEGKKVPVHIGVGNFEPLWGPKGLKSRFIAWATAEKVSAKKLGLLDEGNWSILNG